MTSMNEDTRQSSIVIPAILTAIMIATTLSLGFWQIQRRAEKHQLIAVLTERLSAAPVALPDSATWNALSPTQDEFRRVTVPLSMERDSDALVYGAGSAVRTDVSGAGVWVFTPAKLPNGRSVIINRGFVGDADRVKFDAEAASAALPASITGYIRFPEASGRLTPMPDVARRLWFVRDLGAMAQALNWGEIAPFYIDMESPMPAGGLPKPGPLNPQLRDEHMQYAITWFGLAIALACAFGFWLNSRRRVHSTSA